MPLMLLPFVPLIAAFVGMFIATAEPKCHEFECIDLVHDSLDCDVCWCYEEGGFGCFCCTMCHAAHDDSSDEFYAYAK